MVTELFAANKLLTGIDPGNITTKVSYLDETGNIKDFAISTIIAPAPTRAIALKEHRSVDLPIEEFLHVRIATDSLDGEDKDSAWYVGEYAKNKEHSRQPKIDQNGESEEKFTEQNKAIFVIPSLTAIAIAGVKTDKTEVEVPLSTGIPVETYKLREQKLLDLFYGTHTVTFIDGPYKGKVITIVINEGEIQVESVTTSMALEFTIKDGQCVPSEIGQEIGQRYALGDLGAGTTDVAVFTEHGVEKTQTHNTAIGTNRYIDDIIAEISELEAFAEVKKHDIEDGHDGLAFKSREKFVNQIVKPQVDLAFESLEKNIEFTPNFKVTWGWKRGIDVTDIVIKHITKYVEDQKKSLLKTYAQLDVDHFLLVGGGVLFGFNGGISVLASDEYGMKFPSLRDSQYFTSRAYLIANYLTQWEKQQSMSV